MTWNERLLARMKVLGMNTAELARLSGLPYDSVNKYVRGDVENPRGKAMAKLAAAVGVTENWLRFGDEAPSASGVGVPVRGEVAAGNWVEPEELDEPRASQSVPVDPRWPASAQQAWIVRGRSVEKTAKDGEVILAVSLDHIEPRDGDLVVAERSQGQRGLVERTAKRLRIFRDRSELWPEYTDDALNVPLALGNGKEDVEVAILAVAVSIIKPIVRR